MRERRKRIGGDIEDERQGEKKWRDSESRGVGVGRERWGERRDKRKSGRRGEVETE